MKLSSSGSAAPFPSGFVTTGIHCGRILVLERLARPPDGVCAAGHSAQTCDPARSAAYAEFCLVLLLIEGIGLSKRILTKV
jgi:hypothetical protein